MAVWRVELEMDAEDLDKEGFIECLLNMHYKDWKHHVVHLSDIDEMIDSKRKELASVRSEASILGWSKALRLLEQQLLDELKQLEEEE